MRNDHNEDDMSDENSNTSTCTVEDEDTIDASNDTSMDESDTLLTRRTVSDIFYSSRALQSLDTLDPPTPLPITHSDPGCGYEEEGSPYRPPTKSLRTQSMKFPSAVTREPETQQNFLGPHRNEPFRPYGISFSSTMQRGESADNLSPYNDESRFGKLLSNTRRHNHRKYLTASSGNIPVFNPNQTFVPNHPLKISKKEDSCDFVSTKTVSKLAQGRFGNLTYQIIDCRYDYEYVGGHIKNAKHVAPSVLDKKLKEIFTENVTEPQNTVLIFHCEFSSKRGPAAYKAVRDYDRKLNHNRYPYLYYPYIYVMEGGYREFYKDYKHLCEGEYIEMKDKKFSEDLRHNLRLGSTASLCKHAKISRSSSFSSVSKPNTRLPLPPSGASNVENYFLGATSSPGTPTSSCRSNLSRNFTITDGSS